MLKYVAASGYWHDEQDLAHMSGDHLINGIRADFAKIYQFSGPALNAPEYVPSGSAVNPFYPMLAREPDQPMYDEWALIKELTLTNLKAA